MVTTVASRLVEILLYSVTNGLYILSMPMSSAERQRAYISRLKAGIPTTPKPRKPVDRRSKPQRWDDAVAELLSLLDGYQEARDTQRERQTAIPGITNLIESMSGPASGHN
jgi:hypothetical protein